MSKNKKAGIIGIIITILLLLSLVAITNGKLENVTYIEIIASKTVTPIKNALTHLKNKIEGNNSFFETIESLETENEKLKEYNKQLEQKISELEIIKAENNTLKEYMKIADYFTEYEVVPATIISRDITNINSVITINVGKNQGVEKNMAIVTTEGLVGHIISVTDNSAKVQLIIDAANTVSAIVSNNRDAIICRGILEEKNSLKAVYISTEANISTGDKLETSGMGGIYPKGISIGEIKEVIETKNITDRYAIIETYVDFSKIEYVGVLKVLK